MPRQLGPELLGRLRFLGARGPAVEATALRVSRRRARARLRPALAGWLVSVTVSYYGGGVAETASEKPKCPVIFHFGETDQSIPPDHHAKIRAEHPDLPMHIYQQAGHGFSCDERGSFHAPSATLARTRTMEFLAKHL